MNLLTLSIDTKVAFDGSAALPLPITQAPPAEILKGAAKRAYIHTTRARYHQASRHERGQILSSLCEQFGYHRKHAIRLMSNVREIHLGMRRPARQPSDALLKALSEIRQLTGFVGARKLRALLPEWIPSYRASHAELSEVDAQRLCKMSHATITRMIARTDKIEGENGMREVYAGLLAFASSSLVDVVPQGIGCVFVREVLLCETKDAPIRRALCAVDALSGWVTLVPFESSIEASLLKLEARLPFKVQSLMVQATEATDGVAARGWAWQREEPIPFSFCQISSAEHLPLLLASRDAERVLNHGTLSMSPHAEKQTPAQVVRALCANEETLRHLGEECSELYQSGKQIFDALVAGSKG